VKIYAIDATALSVKLGIPGRINMIIQTVFFSFSGALPTDKTIPPLKKSIATQYVRKGKGAIAKNQAAVDSALDGIKEVKYDKTKRLALQPEKKVEATDFDNIPQHSIENRDDEISVHEINNSAPVPAGTTKKEKRSVAVTVPVWNSAKCVQRNTCSTLCRHGVIPPFLLPAARKCGLVTIPAIGKELKGLFYWILISPLDCTGCGVWQGACPGKALSMTPLAKAVATEQKNFDLCLQAKNKGYMVSETTVRGSQFQRPLLEFNGACPGCGEPAIVKLLTHLYGDRLFTS
jgi:pyruvate-ferredoxin/flavodoxin oxidoreductase